MFGKTIQDAATRLFNAAMDTPVGEALADRVGDVREAAFRAQADLMSAANLPTSAELDRLFAQLRSISQRLEDIEDKLDAMDARLVSKSNGLRQKSRG